MSSQSPTGEAMEYPPSLLLSLGQPSCEELSLLRVAYEAWGLTWVPDDDGGDLFRKPLFTLTGLYDQRWKYTPSLPANPKDGPELTLQQKFRRLAFGGQRLANYEWFALWAKQTTEVLEHYTQFDDTVLGDRAFFAFIELLMMLDEVSDLFRGNIREGIRSMEISCWTDSKGPGLKLLAYLHKNGEEAFENSSAPVRVFTPGEGAIEAQEQDLIALRGWSISVLGKFVEVIQSPALESRFKAFFSALACQLGINEKQMYSSLSSFGRNSNYVDDAYHSLFRAKFGQVFGLLTNDDDEPIRLTEALDEWLRGMPEAPAQGWSIGEEFEAKANAERLKLISDESRGEISDLIADHRSEL